MQQILLSLHIALRFIPQWKQSGIIPLLSIISTVSIALGVIVTMIGLSTMNGFERELNNRILAVVPHGEIEPIGKQLSNWGSILPQIKNITGIKNATPYIKFFGLAEYNNKFQMIQIRGLELSNEKKISKISNYVLTNIRQNFSSKKKYIIIGLGIANKLGVKIGDWITIIIPNVNQKKNILQSTSIRLQIKGILSLHGQLDHYLAIIPLADAQYYLQMGNHVTGIAIKVNDVFNADNLAHKVSKKINTSVKVRSWITSYGYVYHDIQMIRIIIYLTMVLMIGISSFNIIAIVTISIKSKSNDIAILRTIGAENNLIRNIFIWYGLMFGISGSLIGIIISCLLILNLTKLIKWLENIIGSVFLSSNIYFIDFIPTELHTINIVVILITTIIFSLLASWYPAHNTSNIKPAKILCNK